MILILGATFDPIHLGHIDLVNTYLKYQKHKIDLILLLPAKNSWHKSLSVATDKARIAMLATSISSIHFDNVNIELLNWTDNSPTYTANDLAYLKSKYKSDLIFLMGADSLLNLHKWYHWQTLLQLAVLVVFPREGYVINAKQIDPLVYSFVKQSALSVNSDFECGSIWVVDKEVVSISSSLLRHNCALSQWGKVKPYVSTEVYRYLKKNKLYDSKNKANSL